jgi:branched-chain amino acid transport system substrate-binding protein
MRLAGSLVVAIALCAACGNGPPASGPSSDVFKVGVVLPLTGSTAWGGRPAKIAAELAAREINEKRLAGAFQVELDFADGGCAPRTAYAAADKLVNEDHVQVLIGEWCSSASIAVAQVASDSMVPMLVPISTADGIAKSGGPYVFQTIMQNSAIQHREAALLLQRFKFKTVALLVENNDFGLSFRSNMRRALEAAGVKVLLDVAQDRQDANWYPVITRINGAQPDLVVVSISADQAATFVKQYAESNVRTPVFSDYTPPPYIFEQQVGRLAGRIGLVRGTFFANKAAATPRQRQFVASFEPLVERELGEHRPTVHWDIVTYDAVMIVADALKRGGAAHDALLKSLASTQYDGVLGRYEFDADRAIRPEGFDFLFVRTTPEGMLEVVD